MGEKCPICGTNLGDDLFSAVTGEGACSICVTAFGLWTPVRDAQVEDIRKRLGLEPGKYLEIDRGEAARILTRRIR